MTKIKSPVGVEGEAIRKHISSIFGPRIIKGVAGFHYGIDLAGWPLGIGSPIYAVADGVIEIARYSSTAGNYIRINHGNGIYTRYLHMDKIFVYSGTIRGGQLIGSMGWSGSVWPEDARGTHLHFDIMINNSYVDPLPYLLGEKTFIAEVKSPMKTNINVKLNNQLKVFEGVFAESRAYLPIRALLESLGYKVDWDPMTETVIIEKQETTVITRPESWTK